MDILIGKLHQKLSEKVANQTPQGGQSQSQFANILDKKIGNNPSQLATVANDNSAQKLFEKMAETLTSEGKNDIKVISAEDVKVSFNTGEFKKEVNTDIKSRFFSLFEDLNSDFLNINSAIEVLADPGMKLNKRQLLAYQAGIGNMSINAELFSRLAQTVAQNLNTLLNTNIG